ncbi:Phosphatidate phosphatase [Bertholletia excelsa]
MTNPPPPEGGDPDPRPYRKGDQLGHFLAWVSLLPVFISFGGFVCHFIFRCEIQGMFFALGLSVSQFINESIKTWVQQARPQTCALLEICDSHGWPSSHSQYMFFFATYFSLMTYFRIGTFSKYQMWFMWYLVWPLALLTLYSRVYLGYHTGAQVSAGAAVGSFLGVGWFWMVNSMLRLYFLAIEESAFGRIFYVKDTSHIPNVLELSMLILSHRIKEHTWMMKINSTAAGPLSTTAPPPLQRSYPSSLPCDSGICNVAIPHLCHVIVEL